MWEQFNNFVVILLIVAAIVSALLGDYVEAGAIIAIVILNAVFGIVQERRAEQALAALQKLASPEANIVRDGHRITVQSYQLVPGDIVFLEAGNYCQHAAAPLYLRHALGGNPGGSGAHQRSLCMEIVP